MDRLSEYFRHLKALLRRRGCSREDAEDLIQDAFVRMQTYCERGGEVREPEAFLVRIVTRLASNARRDRHSNLYLDQDVDTLTSIVDTQPLPDEVLAADECLDRMRKALDAASRRTRDVFFMHRLDGLSYAQIARQMDLSVSAIEKHMASALVILTDVSEEQ
jgi:RNA polymerase sigma factor (sigma-70 family)